ncbi:type II toxin-antitoxin system RelE/ParE family toxin [Ectopseudomonas oleovorans]|uniref:type II toxin-antitoxin system RelE/ParE family toxin n=1 Tax=Ectopseudomonas oleovorans TaxID=301 RepID=UPI0019D1D0B6|nr:type II toxin-antitoxin system RelE/ParE family toxin [Pseudomonas oleovorans]MBN7116721.1 addiction module antitoxin RelB [Pseudomonas oleovorans]MBN7133221.1 addiction module antitoxin RelB [Pseudomonas oleovorans]MBN7142275.1 addiction module antitoxin RelB [Pseudomonas oleovorans]
MVEIIKSETFSNWIDGLRDLRARAQIQTRIRRLSLGNPGDVKPIGEGLSEMRIDYGPGYRVYFMQRGAVLVIVLCGGDKTTQGQDIKTAKRLAAEWR